jgi:hypothetical protein
MRNEKTMSNEAATIKETKLSKKYDKLGRIDISRVVDGIPEVIEVLNTGVLGKMWAAESISVWEDIITNARKDLDPAQTFLFLCEAEYLVGFQAVTSREKHFGIVPRECYKSNALAVMM